MSAPIAFYHTLGDTPASLEGVLPALLEKALKGGNRVLLITPTPTRQQRLDEWLWTYADAAFLPHGKPEDPKATAQPVLIAHAEEDLAKHLENRIPLVLAGAESVLPAITGSSAARILYMFTASTADVERGRTLFKQLKGQGHAMSYHQQTATGWQQKA
ncbi:MAG: DNA polymerase III subunit chi [Alphaproteobacteria bacterium]|nr:MAG: DNA polymerase III subunit chi [Alphaproteobacteria bacterium]